MKKIKLKPRSTLERSFIKGIIWEGISFILTALFVYLVYGNIIRAVQFSLVLTLIKVVLYFVHERCWKMVRWGKY